MKGRMEMKLTKLASAALAMTMAFSFAPVFAADGSSTTDDVTAPSTPVVAEATVNGEKAEVTPLTGEAQATVTNKEEVAQIFKDSKIDVPADAQIVLLDSFDLDLTGFTGTEAEVTLDVSKLDLKSNEDVYVMHQMKSGEWEVKKAEFNEKGELVVTLTGLSPVAIFKVEKDAPAEDDKKDPAAATEDNKKEPTKVETTTSTVKTTVTRVVRTSPNTGI